MDNNVSSGKYLYRLKQIDNSGGFKYSNEVEADINTPAQFALNQNYPNPFNPTTAISYQLAADSYVILKVYDVLGREVATLVNEYQLAGSYNYQLSTGSYQLSSGIYFYRLTAGNFYETKKLILMK